jgi:hypothetical protein
MNRDNMVVTACRATAGDTATVSAANWAGEMTGDALRRKVFEVAGNDDLGSADERGGDHVFVIGVRKSESAVEGFPVLNARVVESR